MQFILENVLRGKLKTFQNNSALCLSTLKKIYCAEFAPPCFPEDKEDIVLRTVCKRDCEDVKRKCPEVYKEHFGDHAYCEQLANEKSDLKGFCKLTKWPTAVRWPSRPEHVRTGNFRHHKPLVHMYHEQKMFVTLIGLQAEVACKLIATSDKESPARTEQLLSLCMHGR